MLARNANNKSARNKRNFIKIADIKGLHLWNDFTCFAVTSTFGIKAYK